MSCRSSIDEDCVCCVCRTRVLIWSERRKGHSECTRKQKRSRKQKRDSPPLITDHECQHLASRLPNQVWKARSHMPPHLEEVRRGVPNAKSFRRKTDPEIQSEASHLLVTISQRHDSFPCVVAFPFCSDMRKFLVGFRVTMAISPRFDTRPMDPVYSNRERYRCMMP